MLGEISRTQKDKHWFYSQEVPGGVRSTETGSPCISYPLTTKQSREEWEWEVVSSKLQKAVYPWDQPEAGGNHSALGSMATHSSTLDWKIPWTKEPGRLQSMGSQRVGHDWATLLSLFFDWWWLQATFWRNQREEKGNIKRGSQEEGGLLWSQPAPISWECLSHKRSVCLTWTEL